MDHEIRMNMKAGLRFSGVVLFISMLGIVLLSCDDTVAPRPPTELERAEQRWASQSVHSYTYETHSACFCFSPLTAWCRVSVIADTISSVTYVESGESVDTSEFHFFKTIEEQFAYIRRQTEDELVQEVSVDYDSLYGYPTEIRVVGIPDVTDYDAVHWVYNFHPTPHPQLSGDVSLPPNNSLKPTGPFVTRLALWESRQAARQPARRLSSVR